VNGRDSSIAARLAIARELGDRPMVAKLLAASNPSLRDETAALRFTNLVGWAMVVLYLAALAGAIAAISIGALLAGWLFVLAMGGATVTFLAIGIFQSRLRHG
jgi:hypothetical protein